MSSDYSLHSSLHSSLDSEIVYTPENTIIFTIARMNPPTPGHLSVIQTLIEQGIVIGVPKVYVILSKTDDDNENPITCPQKIDVLGTEEKINVLGTSEEKEEVLTSEDRTNNMIYSIKHKMKLNTDDEEIRNKIDSIVVKTICVSPHYQSATPFTTFFYIVNRIVASNLNLILVIGEDRNDLVESIRTAIEYNKKKNKNKNVASVQGIILTRKNMSEYKGLNCGELLQLIREKGLPERTSISASFVRDLVKCGLYAEFHELYSPYLNEEKIENLYQQIQEGLTKPDPKKSKSAKSKSAKSKSIRPMSDVQSTPVQSVFKIQSEFNEKVQSESKESESTIKRRQSKRKRKGSQLEESKSEDSQSIERGPKEKIQIKSSKSSKKEKEE